MPEQNNTLYIGVSRVTPSNTSNISLNTTVTSSVGETPVEKLKIHASDIALGDDDVESSLVYHSIPTQEQKNKNKVAWLRKMNVTVADQANLLVPRIGVDFTPSIEYFEKKLPLLRGNALMAVTDLLDSLTALDSLLSDIVFIPHVSEMSPLLHRLNKSRRELIQDIRDNASQILFCLNQKPLNRNKETDLYISLRRLIVMSEEHLAHGNITPEQMILTFVLTVAFDRFRLARSTSVDINNEAQQLSDNPSTDNPS